MSDLQRPDDPRATSDPVLRRRERIGRFVEAGKRIGYASVAAAVVLFVVAFALQFPGWLVSVVIACLVIACVALPPAIVLGYGIKAADAEDRGEKFGY